MEVVMYKLRIATKFCAAHKLIGYEGKCENLHGHSWIVEVFVIGKKLNKIGILTDFKILKNQLNKIIDNLDHSYLNDFKDIGNPSAENLSEYIFKTLQIPSNVNLEKVRVWESDTAYAEYFE
jgi:6-pyruvoyltetrahydropterin/6-carboxytetrahydropterin synthase